MSAVKDFWVMMKYGSHVTQEHRPTHWQVHEAKMAAFRGKMMAGNTFQTYAW